MNMVNMSFVFEWGPPLLGQNIKFVIYQGNGLNLDPPTRRTQIVV